MLALLITTQLLAATSAASSRGPALHIATAMDRQLSCPANATLEKAVRLRLPAIRIAAGGRALPGDLLAALVREGPGWRFEVKRADGTVAMSRELAAMPCAQLAETSALILERYLAGIDWSGREVGIVPLPEPPREHPPAATPDAPRKAPRDVPEPPVEGRAPAATPEIPIRPPPREEPIIRAEEPTPDAGQPEVITLVTQDAGVILDASELDAGASQPAAILDGGEPTPSEPALTAFTIGAGGGAWLGLPAELSATISIEIAIRIFERFHASLLFFGGTSAQRAVTYDGGSRGSLQIQAYTGFGTFSICSPGSGVSVCGGVIAGVRVTSGGAAGPSTGQRLFSTSGALAALPELGLYGHFSWPVWSRFSLSADLAAAAPLGRASFDIQGISQARYTTPPVDLTGTLYVGFRLF